MATLMETLLAYAAANCSGLANRINAGPATSADRYDWETSPSLWWGVMVVSNVPKSQEVLRAAVGRYQPHAQKWAAQMTDFANNTGIPAIRDAIKAESPMNRRDIDSRLLLAACDYMLDADQNKGIDAMQSIVRATAAAESKTLDVAASEELTWLKTQADLAAWSGGLS